MIADQSSRQLEETELAAEVLRTNLQAFGVISERARSAYVAFVNFAPSVSPLMQEVDKWHQQFEYRR